MLKALRIYLLLFVSVALILPPAALAAEEWEPVVWGAAEDRVEEFVRLCLGSGLTSADVFWANDYASGLLPEEGDVLLVPKSKSALLPTWLEAQRKNSGGSEPLVTIKLHGTPQVPLSDNEPMVTVPLHKVPDFPHLHSQQETASQPSIKQKTPSVSLPSGKMMWPVEGKVSSGFGRRGKRSFHAGIDIPMPKGAPVAAAQNGVVTDIGSSKDKRYRGYGNVVLVDHGGGITALYAHCTSVSVKKGQKVRQGDVIGTVGNTGRTTTHHLHFEVHKNGKPVDPLSYLVER